MHPTLSPLTPRRIALGLLCACSAGAWAQEAGTPAPATPTHSLGFNLGLASAQRLAQGIVAQQRRGADIAAAGMLASYQRGHRLATRPLYEATNAIAGLYNDSRLPARLLRGAALRAAQGVVPFRKLIAGHLTQARA